MSKVLVKGFLFFLSFHNLAEELLLEGEWQPAVGVAEDPAQIPDVLEGLGLHVVGTSKSEHIFSYYRKVIGC